MLHILSAVPGTGKTLYVVSELAKRFAAEKRPIYYTNIPGLKLPWIEVKDPTQWQTAVGPGGVLIIDEAQDWFGPTQPGKEPDYIKELSKHRHNGIDIWFVTQHPTFLHAYVRKNCSTHIHLFRAFGWHRATVREWGSYNESFESEARKKLAMESTFKYPKEAFDLYTSSSQHTSKKTYPKSLFVAVGCAMLFVGGCVYMYKWINGIGKQPGVTEVAKAGGSAMVPQMGQQSSGAAAPPPEFVNGRRDPMAAQHLIQPAKVEKQPWQEDRFAKLDEPRRAPHPAGCVQYVREEQTICVCYTEDGTTLQTRGNFCAEYMAGAVFAYWRDPRGDRDAERSKPLVRERPEREASPTASASGPAYTPMTIAPGAPVTGHRSSDWAVPPKYQ